MEKYEVYENEPVMFHNRAFSCIGTGRMDLALHKEYLDQLALVQKKIGFDYIRGHGLFCKDMAIYQEFITPDGSVKEEYNFSNARKNPYAKKLKKQVTINLDNDTIGYFKEMARTSGIPYQTLINLYLSDCAVNGKKLNISWN